jgi:hypothetical protein
MKRSKLILKNFSECSSVKTVILLFLIVFFQFSSGCKKDDDRNSIKIEVDGVIVEKGTNQPIPDVYVTFTGPAGDYATTRTSKNGSFRHQFFGSKTAKLTLKKEGYIFEYTAEGTDSIKDYRTFTEGTYEDLILEMRKVSEN